MIGAYEVTVLAMGITTALCIFTVERYRKCIDKLGRELMHKEGELNDYRHMIEIYKRAQEPEYYKPWDTREAHFDTHGDIKTV